MNDQNERFKKIISVMIAVVAVFASISAFLQSYASAQDAESDRRAQKLSLEATNKRFTGTLQFSYDWQGAFQTWRELDLQAASAELAGDTISAQRYKKLRDKVLVLSPMLAPPYFNGESWTFPDTSKYEADLYLVEATRLSEEFSAEAEVGNVWHDRANVFVIQLSFFAVTLSLYGLSITMKGMVRGLFIVIGSGIVVFNLIWTGIILLFQPTPTINTQAIDAFSQGVGKAYEYKDEEAVALFDQAIAADPTYANAYYERANSYYNLGNYTNAILDYRNALDNGRDDANVRWNLGWVYYLEGRFEDAYNMNQPQVAADPTLIGLRFNQALILLVEGRMDEAASEFNATILEAERQVKEARTAGQEPPANLWFYMDAAALDLQNLIDQMEGNPKYWTEAPGGNLVRGNPEQVIQFARDQIKFIKEASVSLEYAGHLPAATVTMSVPYFSFGHDLYDQTTGELIDFEEYTSFPSDTSEVTVYFEYDGLPQEHLLWKVYQDGYEFISMRTEWDIATIQDNPSWYKYLGYGYTNVFVMPAGEYIVELYADYHLVATDTFYIEE